MDSGPRNSSPQETPLYKLKNPFTILGVSKDASPDEIKRQYRKKSLIYHPDTNPDNQDDAVKNMQALTASYDLLMDPAKYEMYRRGWIDLYGSPIEPNLPQYEQPQRSYTPPPPKSEQKEINPVKEAVERYNEQMLDALTWFTKIPPPMIYPEQLNNTQALFRNFMTFMDVFGKHSQDAQAVKIVKETIPKHFNLFLDKLETAYTFFSFSPETLIKMYADIVQRTEKRNISEYNLPFIREHQARFLEIFEESVKKIKLKGGLKEVERLLRAFTNPGLAPLVVPENREMYIQCREILEARKEEMMF